MAREMQHTIKITGDNKKLKEALRESDRILKGSTKVTETYTKLLRSQLELANKKLEDLGKNLKSFDNIKAFKEQTRQVKELKRELEQIQKTGSMGGGTAGGVARGGRMGGMMGSLRGIPMIGPLLGVAGMSAMAMQMYQQRAAMAGMGLQSRALGGKGFRSRGAFGFGGMETMQQALGLTRSVGNERGMEDLQALSRATGLDADTLIQSAGIQRRGGTGAGSSLAAVRKTMSILSQTLGDTLDKGRIGEYLQSIDQSTAQFSQGGQVSSAAIAQAFSGLLGTAGFKSSPGRAGTALGAIDATMKGSTGARFGFMSSIMAEALGPKATPLNIMRESGLGLFGAGGQLGADRSSKVFGALRGRLGKMGLDQGSGGLFLGRQFGLSQGIAEDLFKAIMSGDFGKAQKLSSKGMTAEDYRTKAIDLMKTTDGNIKSVAADIESMKLSLGENLGQTVSAFYQLMGGEPLSKTEQSEKEAATGRSFEKRRALRLANRLRGKEGADNLSKLDLMEMSRVGSTGVFSQKEAMTMVGNLETEKRQLQDRMRLTPSVEQYEKLNSVLQLVEQALKTFKVQVEVKGKGKAKVVG